AIKYNRPGGTVRIACECGGEGKMRLTVSDTGAGIRPGDLERIFEPFERAGAEATSTEGTGLGLAISRKLMEAMDGRLGADSVPLDLARIQRRDVVVLDLHLPDMPGEAVLRALQAEPATAGIPVIIASADATPGQVERLSELGARAYLPKPIDVRRLLELLDE